MKNTFAFFLTMVLAFIAESTNAQKTKQPVYVIVHGAWGGGWAFKKTDSLLTAKGNLVYRPTLAGQGEKVHLATTSITLQTHIQDVVNTILYEDLYDVILVGHSYGGMVITGVADSLPGRIRQLIYLDAFVPADGESVLTILGEQGGWITRMAKNGFLLPSWVKEGQTAPKDVPHPLKTFTDPLPLKNPARVKLPSSYILTVAKGTDAGKDDFASQAERAKKNQWKVVQMEADHNPQWSAPEALVLMLEAIRLN